MKWTVVASILLCAANFVTALSFLAVSSYNLSSTENRYPLPAVDAWRGYLLHIIPLAAGIMVMALFSCWGVTKSRKAPLATFIILLHVAALATCIVYCRLVAGEIEKTNYNHEEIKNRTLKEFERNRESKYFEKKWVPEWLDSVQKQSKSCCGVIGFEDWRQFWPGSPEVPVSCCRNEQRCITDIDQIDWPEKPTDYIKNDEGCASKIIESAGKRIKETLKFLVVLVILLTCALLAFAIQYVREFFLEGAVDGKDNGGGLPCLYALCSKFMKQPPPGDGKEDAGDNGQLGNKMEINLDQPEIGTYSYTYLEQLRQQESQVASQDPISQQDIDPPPISVSSIQQQQDKRAQQQQQQQQQQPRPQNSRSGTGNPGNDPGIMFTSTTQKSRQPPAPQQPPPTYGYEVVTPAGKINVPNRLSGGSAQSLPDESAANPDDNTDPAGQPGIFPDDPEKQNLKQLLRFGRRHRRHRKGDMDSTN